MEFSPKKKILAAAAAAVFAVGGLAYLHANKGYKTCEEGQAAIDRITHDIDLRNQTAVEKADATLEAHFTAKNGQACHIKSTTLYKKSA